MSLYSLALVRCSRTIGDEYSWAQAATSELRRSRCDVMSVGRKLCSTSSGLNLCCRRQQRGQTNETVVVVSRRYTIKFRLSASSLRSRVHVAVTRSKRPRRPAAALPTRQHHSLALRREDSCTRVSHPPSLPCRNSFNSSLFYWASKHTSDTVASKVLISTA